MKKPFFTFQFYTILVYMGLLIIGNIIFYSLVNYFNLNTTYSYKNQFILQCIFFMASSILFILASNYFYNKQINVSIAKNQATIDRYEALGNATSDAIWDYDMKTGKVFYNERLLTIFGYTREELADNTNWWENNIHTEEKGRVLDKMNYFLKSNKTSWEDQYLFRCKTGEYKNVYDRSFILRDKNGNPIRLIGAMKDVTKMRSLEKALVEKQLNEKNSLGKTIMLAHEKERKNIKDLLHEDVSQLLASIKIFISRNKAELVHDNIKMSLGYLDDVMMKINTISNKLLSSTFDLFGFVDGVKEMVENYESTTEIKMYLDATNFNETNTDKTLNLHLFRILENRMSLIVEKIKTNQVNITLSNNKNTAEIIINFKSDNSNADTLLADEASKEIQSKLEMYDGKMELLQVANGNYSILAIVK